MYFDAFTQISKANEELPEYRTLVRSIIPARLQEHMWGKCFSFSGSRQTIITECAPPKDLMAIQQTFERLVTDPQIKLTLTYWMSTVSLVTLAIKQQQAEPKVIINKLNTYIDSR